eukprot:1638537-Pyramimonas_sp.AAC.1
MFTSSSTLMRSSALNRPGSSAYTSRWSRSPSIVSCTARARSSCTCGECSGRQPMGRTRAGNIPGLSQRGGL